MKRILCILALSVSLASAAMAQETLSVGAAVDMALAGNASLTRSKLALDAARRAMDRSWNALLPGLTLGAGAAGSGSASSAYGSATASATLSSAFIGDVREARAEYEIAALAYATAKRQLELDVRKAYYSLVLAKENIALIEQSIATAQKSYDQAESKRKAGLAPELDAMTALVALETLKPTLASARVTFDNGLASFKQSIGLDQPSEIALGDALDAAASITGVSLPSDPAAGATAAGLSAPAVTALQREVDLASAKKKSADSAIYSPTLSLSVSYEPTLSSHGWDASGSASAALRFSIDDMLPWSKARQTAAAAADSVASLESRLAEAKTSATISAQSLARKIGQSLSSMQALRLNVTLAERTYALIEEAYKFGTKDISSLQGAQGDLRSARVKVLEEAYTLISAVLDLEYALGVPFETLGR